MKLIMDFDQAVYACGFGAEGEPLSHALHLVKKAIERQLSETGCKEYQIYLGGTGNFRVDLDPSYKAHRTARKPEFFHEIREFLITRYNAETVDGMEVDDYVSMLLWQDFKEAEGDREKATLILSSPDKDLKNTPGYHYYPKSGQVEWVNDTQAHRHFLYQLIAGDPVDNVKGLPGLSRGFCFRTGIRWQKGVAGGTAKKIMALVPFYDVHEAEIMVYRAYISYFLDEGWEIDKIHEYLNLQGQLLWMLREVDCVNQPILWSVSEEMWNVARQRERESIGFDPEATGEKGEGGTSEGGASEASGDRGTGEGRRGALGISEVASEERAHCSSEKSSMRTSNPF